MNWKRLNSLRVKSILLCTETTVAVAERAEENIFVSDKHQATSLSAILDELANADGVVDFLRYMSSFLTSNGSLSSAYAPTSTKKEFSLLVRRVDKACKRAIGKRKLPDWVTSWWRVMRHVTVEQVMAWRPCVDWTEERAEGYRRSTR